MSKGEEKITKILNRENIIFQREKSFSDLKHGLFRYDFYINNYHGRKIVIEYNGEQHYHFVSKFYKNSFEWKKMQEHDRRKISYCLANNIEIYLIPFWEIQDVNSVEDILQKKFLAQTRWKNDEDVKFSPLNNKI